MGFWGFVFVYVLGGLTLLPGLAVALYYYSKWYLPEVEFEEMPIDERTAPSKKSERSSSSSSGNSLLEKEIDTGVDAYITGWLTVSKDYFIYPNGGPKNSFNPPSAASNDASISQSESAYSSLYKLMSNNSSKSVPSKKSSGGTPSSSQSSGSSSSKLKKYFAVLKHGNLFLYQDADQSSVKHVIVIANHVVTIWPPNVEDGQLFIKRSAICLAKIDYDNLDYESQLSDPANPPKNAFYLYSDNCAEKEDFYFALIRASKRSATWNPKSYQFPEIPFFDPYIMACPLHYKTREIMELIQTLHSSDANLQSRWLNALLGRLFLAVKDTGRLENFFRKKIVNKLSRVKRPAFLADIEVKKIYCGHSIPYFTNPKLRELTPEGLMVIEANVAYTGNFSIEIATKAILNLGARFKSRNVSLNLSVAVQHLEGKVIFKMKPPPSNRIWYAFETMPKLNLKIEPIVSSKQITYNVVTKAIENRIREVFKETLVLPFMDDLTFFSTAGEFYRGGIWDKSVRPEYSEESKTQQQQKEEAHDEENRTSPTSPSASVDNESFAQSTATYISPDQDSSLRHRNTIVMEMPTDSSELIGPDLDSTIPPELEQSRQASRDSGSISSSADDSSEHDFDVRQHIGELKRGNSEKRPSTESSKPAALVGTVKKWSSWYFKEKFGNKDGNSVDDEKSEKKSEDNDTLIDFGDEKDSSKSQTSEKDKSRPHLPIPAPEPHHFPPELISSLNQKSNSVINSSNPYARTPEMKLPTTFSSDHQPPPSAPPAPEGTTNNGPPTTFAKRKPVKSASSPTPPDLAAYPPVKDPIENLTGTSPPKVNVDASNEGIVLEDKNQYTVASTPENAKGKI